MAITIPPKGDASKKIGAFFTPLSVVAQEIPNMTVKVIEGGFWNADKVYTEFVGGSTPTIVAPSSNAKLVVVALNGNGLLQLFDGAAAANPQLPTIPTDVLPLAAIFVASTSTAITPSAIFDLRPLFMVSTEEVQNLQQELANRPTLADINLLLANKADVDGTPNTTFTMNKDFVAGAPTNNVLFAVKRGGLNEVSIRWNEAADQWEFTNDGTTFDAIGSTGFPAHTHVVADITNFNVGVDARLAASSVDIHSDVSVVGVVNGHVLVYNGTLGLFKNRALVPADVGIVPSDFALAMHTHNIIDVIGLQVALNGKSDVGHNHDIVDLNDFVSLAPVNRHALLYNGTSQTYENRFIVKSDVNNFVEADYVHVTGNETVAGMKTFTSLAKFNVGVDLMGADLITGDLHVGGITGGDLGLEIVRTPSANALLFWDETSQQWMAGTVGNVSPIVEAGTFAPLVHTHVKAQITDFVETDYVHTFGVETVGGNKTFTNNVTVGGILTVTGANTVLTDLTVSGSLTVTGATTSLLTTQLSVEDSVIVINFGQPQTDAGFQVDRGADPDALLFWNETSDTWQIGVIGNVATVSTFGHVHISTDVTDFAARVTTELNNNQLDDLGDVVYLGSPLSGQYLRYNFALVRWENVFPVVADITDFPAGVTAQLALNNADALADIFYVGARANRHVLIFDGVDSRFENRLLVKADVSDFVETDYVLTGGSVAQIVTGIKTFTTDMFIGGSLVITGDLTVNGVNTIVNTTTLTVEDNQVVLNSGEVGAGVTAGISGLLVERGTLTDAQIYFDEASDKWRVHNGTAAFDISLLGHTHVLNDITDVFVSATEVNFLAGVTSNIQTQINGKVAKAGDTMTGALVMPVGSPGFPSLTFTGDTDTGIYSSGPNAVSVAIGGVQKVLFDGSGITVFSSFISGTPGMALEAIFGLGTGVSFPGPGIMDLVVGGVPLMTFGPGPTVSMSVPFSITADLDMNGFKIIDLGTPTLATDAATKGYIDAHAADFTLHLTPAQDNFLDDIQAAGTGIVVKSSVTNDGVTRTLVSTSGNITITNPDGVAGNPDFNLVNVGVPVASSFVKITTDTKGRVSATTPVVAGDITPLVDATYVNVSGDTMTGALAMSSNKITGLASGTVSGDALHFGQIGAQVQAWDADLDALAGIIATGFLARTGAGTAAARTLVSASGNIVITNPAGVLGNPDFDLVAVPPNPFVSVFARFTTDTNGRIIGATPIVTGDITALVDATYVNVSGDTMTGFLTLNADPTALFHAATKQYVDTRVLDNLADVIIAGSVTGHILRYNGTNWVNIAPILDHLTDVTIAGPVTGDLLRFNGLQWVNVATSGVTEFVHTTGAEVIGGAKTFSDLATFSSNVVVNGDLTVQGTTTTVNSNTVNIGDNIITLNSDEVGAPTQDAGVEIERGTSINARLHWEETGSDATSHWEAGLVGSLLPISRVGDMNYQLQSGTGGAGYTTGFSFITPAAGKASLMVFVNGIKQVEGATKAYTITAPNSVTFTVGNEPALGDDVEFYGI